MKNTMKTLNIQELPEFSEKQAKQLAIKFKANRLKAGLKQMELAVYLKINMNALNLFEKNFVLPAKYENGLRAVVNYALTGKINKEVTA